MHDMFSHIIDDLSNTVAHKINVQKASSIYH